METNKKENCHFMDLANGQMTFNMRNDFAMLVTSRTRAFLGLSGRICWMSDSFEEVASSPRTSSIK